MKKTLIALLVTATIAAAADTVRIFAINNKTDAEAIAIYNKLHRQLQKICAEYDGSNTSNPTYFDMADTNCLWSPLNGKAKTQCWDSLKAWTNATGTLTVHWFAALPAETNGIPLKRMVLNAIEKDKIIAYMSSNSCSIEIVASDYKVITNATVIYTFGE